MARVLSAILAVCILSSARPAHALSSYVPGEVLVIPREGSFGIDAAGKLKVTDARLGVVLERQGLARGRDLARGASRVHAFLLSSVSADFDPVAAARELMQSGMVRSAMPNYRLRLSVLPNDPYLSDEWYVQDPSQADIDLPEAWDIEKGAAAIRIGIMDTGVDTGHPDLAAKIWTNPGENPGNGIDDDRNGWIDDVNGWDFGNDDADPNPEPVFDEATGIDVGFHGTFVAALAAAANDNGEGIAGAGWNCSIVPLKVADAAGNLTSAAAAAAFGYASAMHLEVLNMSLGAPDDPGVAEFFQALADDATAAGVLCVAAAGNDGTSALNYPAACNHVLSVGAIDETNARASFSNWGRTVDVAAPGASIWSAICRNYVIDDFSQVFYLYLWAWDGDHPYMYGDGTSFACPLASGVAGLVRSRSPGLTPDQVAHHLVATGDVVTYDHAIGTKLNAYRAMSTPLAVPAAPTRSLEMVALGNPFTTSTTLAFTLPGTGHARLAVFDASGRRVRDLLDQDMSSGTYRWRWDGADRAGEVLRSGVFWARLEFEGRVVAQRIVKIR